MPSTQLRENVLASARRIVVKLGTQLITDDQGRIDRTYLRRIARQIAALRERGVTVTVVSSGAVGSGCGEMGIERPSDVAGMQAVAAIGQRGLMTHYHDAFARVDLKVAQLLLTRDDFDDRDRFLNIRNCLGRLHELGCVPIINENDTVATEELRFGDNDMLAAMVCHATTAEALVLLTVVDGLLDEHGGCVDRVEDVDHATQLARSDRSDRGTGGMSSKLEAARLVTASGEVAVIANGRSRNVLGRLFDARRVGTVFVPADRKLGARRRWIGLTSRPAGRIIVDDGAAEALRKRGKSLLAIGVTEVRGRFDRGQVVAIVDSAGRLIARGLTNYAGEELRRIQGKRSSQFQKLLGHAGFAEVVHRNNMVLADR